MITFANDQWAVTELGLEHQGWPEYEIGVDRLSELLGPGPEGALYMWPVHMAMKPSVNIELFLTAFLHALVEHAGSHPGEVDVILLRDTFAEARGLAAATKEDPTA